MNSYLAIVGREDFPLFEAEFFRSDYLAKVSNIILKLDFK